MERVSAPRPLLQDDLKAIDTALPDVDTSAALNTLQRVRRQGGLVALVAVSRLVRLQQILGGAA